MASLTVSVWILGCGGSPEPEASKPSKSNSKKPAQVVSETEDANTDSKAATTKEEPATESFAPVKLSGGGGTSRDRRAHV